MQLWDVEQDVHWARQHDAEEALLARQDEGEDLDGAVEECSSPVSLLWRQPAP